jgi:hypothetical protein
MRFNVPLIVEIQRGKRRANWFSRHASHILVTVYALTATAMLIIIVSRATP